MNIAEPIRRSVTVGRSQEDAFKIFTEEVGSWWPFMKHSIGEENVATAIIEGKTGGRFFERWHDGTEKEWGTILEWDPHSRLVIAWKPNPNRTSATEIEIRFIDEREGTRVELEHRGWERLGDDAEDAKQGYAENWQGVLDLYLDASA